jgi:glycerate-2-kinase
VKADPVEPVAEVAGPVTAATLKELNAAERAGTALGESALALARRVDGAARDSGASLASLARELRATLAEALRDAAAAADPLDELRARRDRKRTGS